MKKIFGTLAIMAMALTGAGCAHAYGAYHTPHSQISINYQSHPGFISFHNHGHGHGPKYHGPQFHPPKPHHRPAPHGHGFGLHEKGHGHGHRR